MPVKDSTGTTVYIATSGAGSDPFPQEVNALNFFAIDVVLKKMVYAAASFRMDLLIDASRLPSFNAKPKTWSLSYVEPDERIAF